MVYKTSRPENHPVFSPWNTHNQWQLWLCERLEIYLAALVLLLWKSNKAYWRMDPWISFSFFFCQTDSCFLAVQKSITRCVLDWVMYVTTVNLHWSLVLKNSLGTITIHWAFFFSISWPFPPHPPTPIPLSVNTGGGLEMVQFLRCVICRALRRPCSGQTITAQHFAEELWIEHVSFRTQ